MHKSLFTALISSAIICVSLSLSTYHSQAATASYSVIKIRNDGFRKCKSFDRQGKSAWTGVVKGATLNGGSRNNRNFSIRSCFSSQSKCQQFIGNINRIVANVDSIRYRRCSPR